MGEWNYNVDEAPRGHYVTQKVGKGEQQAHVKEYVILALGEGEQVMRSFWIPEENRWNGIATPTPDKAGNTVVAWQHWPEHPNKQKEQG